MADLTPEQVRIAGAAVGISIGDDDLTEVTLRLNATLEHLKELDKIELAEAAYLTAKAL